jgi:hypothetical protein
MNDKIKMTVFWDVISCTGGSAAFIFRREKISCKRKEGNECFLNKQIFRKNKNRFINKLYKNHQIPRILN